MIGKKFATGVAAMFVIMTCCACDFGGTGGETGGSNPGPGTPPRAEFKLADYESLPTVQFSSVTAVEKSGSCKLKMKAPWTDTYKITFSQKAVHRIELYDAAGKLLKESTTGSFEVNLKKGDIVYTNIVPVKEAARMTVMATENKSPLPFEIANAPNPASFDTTGNPNVDPLESANINYVKRENTLYVYCNAPEEVKYGPQVVNKCITRQEVTNQSVYFTFEQQTNGLKDLEGWNFTSNGVYYGYRVTNTGKDDLYITVKNIGWQLDGLGSYYGEKEWVDFYNTNFKLPDMSDLTEDQIRQYEAFLGFSGKYLIHDFQPTTYRIPAGEYMYVMGGTTVDAFGGFNVDDTANRLTTNSTCANGAVLFDVVGQAEGAYYVYNDVSKVMPGGEGCDTHMGIDDPEAYGVVHTGDDVGYVIDNQATWTFNDKTPAQKLPVTYTNYYSDTAPRTGTPNTEIPNTTPHLQADKREWITHIDVQQVHNAVGTDMTSFHTVNRKGEKIIVGCNYYDTRGELPNIGNWMKDYQDLYTFVNQGDKEREITLNLVCTGAVVVMLRDMNGKMIPNTAGYSMRRGEELLKGELMPGFDKSFHYTVKIPAHTVVQLVLEYNLMANAYGNIVHSVDLK